MENIMQAMKTMISLKKDNLRMVYSADLEGNTT